MRLLLQPSPVPSSSADRTIPPRRFRYRPRQCKAKKPSPAIRRHWNRDRHSHAQHHGTRTYILSRSLSAIPTQSADHGSASAVARPAPGGRRIGQKPIGNREDLGFVNEVELARDFPGQLDVRELVFADRDPVCAVYDDVGRLEYRIAQKAVGCEVFLVDLELLLLVGRISLSQGRGVIMPSRR